MCNTRRKRRSFAEERPELLKYWDWEKNEGIDPYLIPQSSTKSVWWKCEEGHSYPREVRLVKGNVKCLVCSSIAMAEPELLEWWDFEKNEGFDPSKIQRRSAKVVWWKCKKGHSFPRQPAGMEPNGRCPECRAKPGLSPELLEMWDPGRNGNVDPESLSLKSKKKYWWICKEGHNFRHSVSGMVRGAMCDVCRAAKKAEDRRLAGLKKSGPLSETHPEIAQQWHPDKNGSVTADEVSHGSARLVWWQCEKGHSWDESPNSRTRWNPHVPCPKCRTRKVKRRKRQLPPLENALSTTHPELAAQWDYERNGELKPEHVTYGSNLVVWWKCSCEKRWPQSVKTRARSDKKVVGCHRCKWRAITEERKIVSGALVE